MGFRFSRRLAVRVFWIAVFVAVFVLFVAAREILADAVSAAAKLAAKAAEQKSVDTPKTVSMKRNTESNERVSESIDPGFDQGEMMIAGTRGPNP